MCVLPISVLLIIDYDILNITFVYLNFPNTVFFTAAIVIAPTIAAIFVKRGTWMQARAYTLAIYMMYIFSFEVLLSRDIGLQLSLPFPRSEGRSEEHTSELQSLMRSSYAVFCLKKKKTKYT